MVFNLSTMKKHRELHPDSKIIDDLGGPAKLAETLGYDKSRGGVQRIQNWRHRGIPAEVKLHRPEIFLVDLIERAKATDDVQPPVSAVDHGNKPKGRGSNRKTKEARAPVRV
jgi:hypothetical protein